MSLNIRVNGSTRSHRQRAGGKLNPRVPANGSSHRLIPSVEKVLQTLGPVGLPRAAVVKIVRNELAALRQAATVPELDAIIRGVEADCARFKRLRLQPVINGTGVLLHTNLGRAPLGRQVMEHVAEIATQFDNLEYDLDAGARGSRAAYVETCLALMCQAEAATVVNNCAAALLLVLRHFTGRKPEVIISRGELLQIGGGFRIPEILEAGGARLREVGTTNQTSLRDYARAIGPETALILKVHRSNFVMDGFVESPASPALAALARAKKVAFVEDLGSGAVIRTEEISGLEHEPTPGELLKQGVDLVTFSGDKLLGGPQAGIITGRAKLVAALKREPLFRALRCDKLSLAALEATVDVYLEGKHTDSIPLLSMLSCSVAALHARAEQLVAGLQGAPVDCRVVESKAQAGGGSLPRSSLTSAAVDLKPSAISLEEFAHRLRHGTVPVIGAIRRDRFRVDLRAVFPDQDRALAEMIRAAAGLALEQPV